MGGPMGVKDTGSTKYPCNECDYSCTNPKYLARHKNKRHKEQFARQLTSIPDKEVVKVVINVWILGLESEDRSVGWSVELDHSLQ